MKRKKSVGSQSGSTHPESSRISSSVLPRVNPDRAASKSGSLKSANPEDKSICPVRFQEVLANDLSRVSAILEKTSDPAISFRTLGNRSGTAKVLTAVIRVNPSTVPLSISPISHPASERSSTFN